MCKDGLGVREWGFVEVWGSGERFVGKWFWGMVWGGRIGVLGKIVMNEGIKKGSLYENVELNR